MDSSLSLAEYLFITSYPVHPSSRRRGLRLMTSHPVHLHVQRVGFMTPAASASEELQGVSEQAINAFHKIADETVEDKVTDTGNVYIWVLFYPFFCSFLKSRNDLLRQLELLLLFYSQLSEARLFIFHSL